MSDYSCNICSFYTDRKIKLVAHNNTLKHRENLKYKTRKKKKVTINLSPQPPPEHNIQSPHQSVFTLLEIKNNQILSSKQINISNSTIDYI